MTRRSLLLWPLLAAAQEPKPVPDPEPPEEDERLKPKEYTFNPLQADQEMRVGQFYWKKGSYRAAARRFEEATRWDPGRAEAYLRLAEALEKLNNFEGARKAYAKYLELAPDAKNANQIRKKLTSKS